jgi:L-lactate dehydrogenase
VERIISIVGFGNIGKLVCALLLPYKHHRFAINIIDIDDDVRGAVTDMRHGKELFPNHSIHYNDQAMLSDSDFIFHCAGASVPKGKSRLYTCQQSIEITEAIFSDFKPNKEPFIIVVANPVEIISAVTQQLIGLPTSHVIGTGTFLDSIRMDQIISSNNPELKDISAILLGEHGATAFLSEELSAIEGAPITDRFDESALNEYMELVKRSAEEIKSTQDATIYGVSYCALHIMDLLMSDEGGLLPVSTAVPEYLKPELGEANIYLSLMCKIDKNGAVPIESYQPQEKEFELLRNSYNLIVPCFPEKYF